MLSFWASRKPDWAGQRAFGSNAVRPIVTTPSTKGLRPSFNEPLGFQVYGGNSRSNQSSRNIVLEMRCFVCRILCALIGFNDQQYIKSPLDTRQRHGVQL